jgi:1,4-dihydroxy-6-naphthoate synthase
MVKKVKIAISPCPNDTFIFENIYNQNITIDGIELEWVFEDIDVLNKMAIDGSHDIVKISFANYHLVQDTYEMLTSGGAMGFGVGPLVVSGQNVTDEIFGSQWQVAIPGLNTTAHFLFSYFYPYISMDQKLVMPFDKIEEWVLDSPNRLGVLIHEGRFTYQSKGLKLVNDLGKLWENKLNLPIPLGCIVAKKSLGRHTIDELSLAISASISNYGDDNRPIISEFIKTHAQEMSEDVMRSHIDLYVNEFSVHMGDKGVEALSKMKEILNSKRQD